MIKYFNFFLIYKNAKYILSQKQGKTPKKARERYHNLSEAKKNQKRQYARETYQNLSEEEKKQKAGILSRTL